MRKKLVIISIDAMGSLDLSGNLDHLPTLKKLIEEGTHVQEVMPIYPSLTYPSHTTILSGVYPRTHGIVNNTKMQSDKLSPDWFWYAKDIKSPTLLDFAHRNKLITAGFLWPVTAKSSITYNIAEIFPNRIWTNQVLISLQASSPLFLFQMNRRFGNLRNGIKQPQLDDFVTACAVDTLVLKKPDLTLIHLVDMDSQRHAYGVTSEAAKHALIRQDRRVKNIIDATKKAETYQDTVFAVLGDHYQIDVEKMIHLNHEFVLRGWQEPKKLLATKKGWQVYAKSCDGSTYIYCDKDSTVHTKEIKELIASIEGVAEIYSTEEAVAQGAAPNCTFMVEAKKGYYFTDEVVAPTVESVNSEDIWLPNRYRAVHGFSPKKADYYTTLVFCGPGIRRGCKIETARLIDEAPTFAEILGINEFGEEIDGEVISGIFE